MDSAQRPETPARSGQRLWLVAAGALAAAPAFLAYASYVLNHFYRVGAPMLDTGLLADLAWRQAPDLPVRLVYGGTSFYAYHIAPIFALLSGLSWLVPLTSAQWFAVFTGAAQALMAVAAFWVLSADHGLRRGWGLVLAAALAIAFSFNGLALAQVRYPHFEVLIAASLMLFLVALRRERLGLAGLFLALALICREDAGFHAFAILFIVTAMRWRLGTPLLAQRPALVFMAVAFAYSLGALVVGHIGFPQQSSFARVYLGDPPFAHLTPALLAQRVQFLLIGRAYIVLPALVASVWAILARNPYLVAGYLAYIPWALVNLLAQGDLAGSLSSYYAFPFLIAAFWPLVGWRMQPRRPSTPDWAPFAWFGLMIVVSFVGLSAQHDPTHAPLWSGLTNPPSLADQARVERALDAVHADRARLGRLMASDSLVSLRPRDFRREETFLAPSPPSRFDTVMDFAGDRQSEDAQALAARSGLVHAYSVVGTPIRVTTNASPATLPALGPLLRLAR